MNEFMTEILSVSPAQSGNILKQGDKTEITYNLIKGELDPADFPLVGLSCAVILAGENKAEVNSEVLEGNQVTFQLPSDLAAGKYKIEFIVDGKYIFPSSGGAPFEIEERI